jgi:deazaflavin-dependent oxidoreductase (nitroreductase family)
MPLPRSIARFNRRVTNRVTVRVAPVLPGFGLVSHTGRRTGVTYETPVNVFHQGRRLRFALTYGRGDWVRNVLAGGPASVRIRGTTYALLAPHVVVAPDHSGLPWLVRMVLQLTKTDEELQADDGTGERSGITDGRPGGPG